MNDQEYFEQYKQAFKTIFSSGINDVVFLKDAQFRFSAVNANMLNFIGAKSITDVINLTSFEVAQRFKLVNSEVAEQFAQQDLQIMQTKHCGTFLEVTAIRGQPKISIIYKTPIINPLTDNFVGIRGQVTSLIWPHAIKTLLKMHGAKGLLLGQKNDQTDSWKQFPLTKMQHMILFLCLNNYSYSEIAILLNEFGYEVTPIRVNDYLEQLKFIFHVRNKTQLIEKVIGLNFHVYLPEGLFNKHSSVDISSEAAAIICFDCHVQECSKHNKLLHLISD